MVLFIGSGKITISRVSGPFFGGFEMSKRQKLLLIDWGKKFGIDQIPKSLLLSPKGAVGSHNILCDGEVVVADYELIKTDSGIDLIYDGGSNTNKKNEIILGRLTLTGLTNEKPTVTFTEVNGLPTTPDSVKWASNNSQQTSLGKTKGHGNPDWTREETILALELYLKSRPKIPSKISSEVKELSKVLRSLPFHKQLDRQSRFRNSDGVVLKLKNIHAAATGQGLPNISKMERMIWEELGEKLSLVCQLAAAIRDGGEKLLEFEADRDNLADIDDIAAGEGGILSRLHRFRERSKGLRNKVLLREKQKGSLVCPSCRYTQNSQLAEAGDSAFEVHHTVPLHISGATTTKLEDLVLLCAICHRMIHRLSKEMGKWLIASDLASALLGKTSAEK